MKLSLETHSANIIHSYEPGAIKIRPRIEAHEDSIEGNSAQRQLQLLTGSLIVTPELLIENWLESAPQLHPNDIDRIMETHPEVILLGTGETMKFPDSKLLQSCYQANVGIEVMNTAAACRTYNVLASEGRKVAAALMII